MLNRKRIVAFLSSILLLLVTGCSKEPPVEKETIKPPARQVSQVKKSKPAGLVGSSHQEETAQKQAANSEQPEASKPTAGSESMAKKANPTGASPAKEANPLPAKKGYRVAQASARGNVLSFLVPEDWKSVPAKSSMRLLQIALPGTSGPDSDGELSVFYFGPSAGTVQMNINRWIGQFSQPDGSSSKDKAKTEEIEGKHHSSTLLDLSDHGAQHDAGNACASGEDELPSPGRHRENPGGSLVRQGHRSRGNHGSLEGRVRRYDQELPVGSGDPNRGGRFGVRQIDVYLRGKKPRRATSLWPSGERAKARNPAAGEGK